MCAVGVWVWAPFRSRRASIVGAVAGAKRAKGGLEALVSAAIVASLRVLCAASWLLSIILTTNRLLPSSWRFK